MTATTKSQLTNLHEEINTCLTNISEAIIKDERSDEIAKLKNQFENLMDAHFRIESQLMAEQGITNRKEHIASHKKFMDESHAIFNKDAYQIDDFIQLQYTLARHELEYDFDLQ